MTTTAAGLRGRRAGGSKESAVPLGLAERVVPQLVKVRQAKPRRAAWARRESEGPDVMGGRTTASRCPPLVFRAAAGVAGLVVGKMCLTLTTPSGVLGLSYDA